jgi:hypothetical protein
VKEEEKEQKKVLAEGRKKERKRALRTIWK